MYTSHYQMQNQPFTERIPVSRVIQDDRMKEALAGLEYLAMAGDIALIVGQTGVGKSTLIKLFLDQLPHKQFLPIYIHFTQVKSSGLFHLIVNELGEDPRRARDSLFLQIMDKTKKLSTTPIIIIDEAHLLGLNALTDIRLLVSSAMDDSPIMKIILAGQNDIKNKLRKSSLTDLAHRISVSYHLKPLTKIQTHAYIDLQMKNVGRTASIFEDEVKDCIHEYTNGIPRQINNIATACLIHGSIQKAQKINMQLFSSTISDLDVF